MLVPLSPDMEEASKIYLLEVLTGPVAGVYQKQTESVMVSLDLNAETLKFLTDAN
jgi:hypothetical protein